VIAVLTILLVLTTASGVGATAFQGQVGRALSVVSQQLVQILPRFYRQARHGEIRVTADQINACLARQDYQVIVIRVPAYRRRICLISVHLGGSVYRGKEGLHPVRVSVTLQASSLMQHALQLGQQSGANYQL
jgi:hypothetical protein